MRGFEVSFSAMRFRLEGLVCHLLFAATFFSSKVGRQNWLKDAITAMKGQLLINVYIFC
jgi:hypothetical protein